MVISESIGTPTNQSLMSESGIITIWIIDDDSDFCSILSKGLNATAQFRCTHTFTGYKTAFKELRNGAERPTVILLDIHLAGANGLEAILPFKESSPHTYIIMLTGDETNSTIQTALKQGVDGYLLKTSGLSNIARAIDSVIKGGNPIDPLVVRKIIEMYQLNVSSETDYGLTKREIDILRLIVAGFTKNEISDQLFLSYYTVDTHYKKIFSKLNVHSLPALIAKATKEKLL